MTNELLTVKDVADYCRLNVSTVRRHIAAGRLASVRVGRSLRIRREALEEFVGDPTYRTAAGEETDGYFREDDPLFGLVGKYVDEPWVSSDKYRALYLEPPRAVE